MIDMVFYFPDGHEETEPEVHPRDQGGHAVPIPAGASSVAVYAEPHGDLAERPAEVPNLAAQLRDSLRRTARNAAGLATKITATKDAWDGIWRG